jgi:hypothetical protein
MDSDDTLEAMAIARMATKEQLEPVDIPSKPYDALAHQIIGLLMRKQRWYFSEICDMFKNAYPYADLTTDDIRKVLTYMHTRFPRLAWVSFEDQLVMKPRLTKALYEYYFDNLSMIPEEKQFAHAAAIMLLTPAGRVSRYFFGVEFAPRDLRLGLIEASENKIGSVVDALLLYCYHYDPVTGKYNVVAMNLPDYEPVLYLKQRGRREYLKMVRQRDSSFRCEGESAGGSVYLNLL